MVPFIKLGYQFGHKASENGDGAVSLAISYNNEHYITKDFERRGLMLFEEFIEENIEDFFIDCYKELKEEFDNELKKLKNPTSE